MNSMATGARWRSCGAALTGLTGLAAMTGLAVLAGCGKAADLPHTSTGAADTAQVSEDDATATTTAQEDTSRARSEPPPGPPVPTGVNVFRRDVVTLSLSGDGRFLVGGDLGGRALLWDLQRSVFVWGDETPLGNRIRPVVFPDRGARWVVGAFDEPDTTWRLYDAAAVAQIGAWGERGGTAIDAAFDPQATHVVTATADPDLIEVFALDGATPPAPDTKPDAAPMRRVWQTVARARAVALDATGARVAWSSGQAVEVRSVADGATLMNITEDVPTSRLVFQGDVLAGAQAASIVRWSFTGAPRAVVSLADERLPIRELRQLPRGLVAVTRPEEQGLVLWDAHSGAPIAEVGLGCACEVHALAADGCTAACACATRTEVRWMRLSGPAYPGCP